MTTPKKYMTLVLFWISFLVSAQEKKNENFYFIAFGDMPYFLPEDYAKFETVITTINAENPAFTVNVGDFKSSSTPCSNEAYSKIYRYYMQFDKPLVYIPGDNEWTDCTKKNAGAYDAEERLALIRKMFFKDSMSFGKEKLKLHPQSKLPGFEKFVENNSWDVGKISFATIHVVGTNNNFLTTSKNRNEEFFEREKADIAWLEEIFKHAKETDQKAVVLAIHADMFSDPEDMKEASGFFHIKKRLRELVIDFKKPVLLVNGDSHAFLINKPFFEDEKKEKTLENFTRLQVPGEANMNVVKIRVNVNSKTVFQFEELVIEHH
jgi:hypothetical protein